MQASFSSSNRESIPDLMASLAEFSALINIEGKVRKTSESPARVSILDVIGTITETKAADVTHVWQRLKTRYPEVLFGCQNFKFAGPGQRETPVADARGITEIIMVLPGKTAAKYRKSAADVIVRYLGGDPSLVDETAQNRLAQENLPDDNPFRIFGETVESETLKRKREELAIAEIDGRIKKTRLRDIAECVTLNLWTLQDLGLPVDDRDRMRAKDMLNSTTHAQIEDTPEDKEVCIRKFLQDNGITKYGMDGRLGKLSKEMYLHDYPAYQFPKKEIYANGQMCSANIWYESQRPYLEATFREILSHL